MAAPPQKSLSRRMRYVVAVARRFRPTLILAAIFFIALPWLYVVLYPLAGGARIDFLRALHHVYFLLFGQPSLDFVDSWYIEILNLAIPPSACSRWWTAWCGSHTSSSPSTKPTRSGSKWKPTRCAVMWW
ncbi:MAG: hypothetical protein QM723_31160 [Myxococcaceae bacterium]